MGKYTGGRWSIGLLALVVTLGSCDSGGDPRSGTTVAASQLGLKRRAPVAFAPQPLDSQVIAAPSPELVGEPALACGSARCYAAWTFVDPFTRGIIAGTRLWLDGLAAEPTATTI